MVESEFKKQTLAVIISCILLCFVFLLYLIFFGGAFDAALCKYAYYPVFNIHISLARVW